MKTTWKEGLRATAMHTAARLPGLRGMVQFGGKHWGRSQQFRDVYSRESPTASTPFSIFRNAWSSAVPGFETGQTPLFDDARIKWFESQLGSFQGKRILELGPLEGGHTSMMERRGARVVAIEANQRAFLKCLIVKNALQLNSEFLFGDFRPYLERGDIGQFDFVVAVGVLYHMLEPLKLLHDIAAVTNSFGLWTHYYEPAIVGARLQFNPNPITQEVAGVSAEVYEQHYLLSVARPGFCGGSEPTSRWLTKNGLMQSVMHLGFELEIGEDNPHHPNGPSILLFAKRS